MKRELTRLQTSATHSRRISTGQLAPSITRQPTLSSQQHQTSTTTALIETSPQKTPLPYPCDVGWGSVIGHCYLIVSERKSWTDASAFCKSKNSYLIEITTDEEVKLVGKFIARYNNNLVAPYIVHSAVYILLLVL